MPPGEDGTVSNRLEWLKIECPACGGEMTFGLATKNDVTTPIITGSSGFAALTRGQIGQITAQIQAQLLKQAKRNGK